MQGGDSTDAYILAATLIPALLLGGFVAERTRPPETGIFDQLGEISFGRPRRASESPPDRRHRLQKLYDWVFRGSKTGLVISGSIGLPLFGAFLVVAEIVALDAIASGSRDPAHALIVGITVVLGLLVSVFVVWLPWLIKLGTLVNGGKTRALLVIFTILAIALTFAAGVPAGVSLLQALESPDSHEAFSHDRVWLEHLLATSDFRLERLEIYAARGLTAEGLAKRPIQTQHEVETAQCEALRNVIDGESPDGPDAALPSVCSDPR